MSVKIEADGQHYLNCPCGKCHMIRKTAYQARLAGMSVVERVRLSLVGKVEEDGSLALRGLFNCADIAELVKLVSDK